MPTKAGNLRILHEVFHNHGQLHVFRKEKSWGKTVGAKETIADNATSLPKQNFVVTSFADLATKRIAFLFFST